ncbi:DUF417 family protein [Hymenobacter sp. B1770]|uniref:DUF417 family protein n=1 Tax=Hymenobacter sp. B1770 TaxID=1718788 RepID=UPI003CF1AA02
MKESLLVDQPTTPLPYLAPAQTLPTASPLARVGVFLLRYSLVLVLAWIGLFKFTPTEAAAIQPLFTHSPLFAWLYEVLSVRTVSNLVGSTEILVAGLMALRPVVPRLSYFGSLGAVVIFLTTVSFLFTTPGAFAVVDGLWVPGDTGSFLIKDLTLLGAACYTAAEARGARQV